MRILTAFSTTKVFIKISHKFVNKILKLLMIAKQSYLKEKSLSDPRELKKKVFENIILKEVIYFLKKTISREEKMVFRNGSMGMFNLPKNHLKKGCAKILLIPSYLQLLYYPTTIFIYSR